LVHDVSRLGEDMLEIRIDFFVLAHNLKSDALLGLRDSASLGLPHELRFINKLAESVLSAPPFPREGSNCNASVEHGIDETSELYEPHGVTYLKHVQQAEAQKRAEAARAAAAARGSSSTAASSKPRESGGKRATKAKKGVTQNLLNAAAAKPSSAAEVERMLKCVKDAESAKKRGRRTKWDVAADLYRDAFIANCAAVESERILICAPTTAAMIKQSYEQMARDHRARVAQASKTPSSEHAAAAIDGDEPAAMQEEEPEASEDAAKPEAKRRASKGRVRWKGLIADGRALHANEVNTMGCTPLSEYLRAMGVKLTRQTQGDLAYLRSEALRQLRDLGGSQWSVSQ
jgi:hypothetical protein